MPRDVYLALGDSITFGYNATRPENAYAVLVHRHLQRLTGGSRARPVGRVVLAQHLWTASRLLWAARMLPQTVWRRAGWATVMIGGNDLRKLLRRQYLPPPLSTITEEHVHRRIAAFEQAYRPLCRLLRDADIPRVVVCTMYNPAPNEPLAVDGIGRLNQVIRGCAEEFGFEVADIHTAFEGREADWIDHYRSGRLEDLISPIRRPIHPNDAGHAAIARCIVERLEPEARRRRNATPPGAPRRRRALHNNPR
ncbi:SGNH/GDSL hydrolase family protein [Alicyclobacillus sp.]|uniref:SGNH/GDSL hydrolase family protein n=1 Tax=Alicyclobacillus sp. TaxID=61169 RepID=UPI0025B84A87|nr:SGNH/GDSL hydrolase family protein [Alicyclobacillus sp.]MCL6517251.1 SGNH/GDSL hydrolase family protein [Alicyclobacillus sp.]